MRRKLPGSSVVRNGAWAAGLACALALVWVSAPGAARERFTGDWRDLEIPGGADRRIVDQREWAARLVEALDLSDALPPDHGPEDVYSLLCPSRVERSVRAEGRRVPTRPPFHVSIDQPTGQPGAPLRMVVAAPATALYVLRVKGRGHARWSLDRRSVGGVDPTLLGVDVGDVLVPLSRGPHELEAVAAPGTRIERVELTAFRPLCIAPAGGWGGDGPLHFGAKARTLVRAFGIEGRLPADGEPLALEGEAFEEGSRNARRTNERLREPASGDAWATASGGPAELAWRFEIEDPGLFSVVARVHGGQRQLWSMDGYLEVRHSPEPSGDAFAWGEVATLPLDGGEHVLRARIAPGSGVDRVHLVRRRTRDADYLALLDQLGFREGAPGAPVTADAAARNLSNPGFDLLVADLLRRVGGRPGDPLALLADDLERYFERPLSPVLPADLGP